MSTPRAVPLPDVPSARRVSGTYNAVSNNGVGLNDTAELGHTRIHRHHARRHLEHGSVHGHFGRGGYRDAAGFELDRVTVAVHDLDRTRTILERDLLPARCFRHELLAA